MHVMGRRVLLLTVASLAGCQSTGHVSIFGYSTRPNYDECIRTVHVPIFENNTFRRGLEYDLTRAVIREIEQKTPFKVVSDRTGPTRSCAGRSSPQPRTSSIATRSTRFERRR